MFSSCCADFPRNSSLKHIIMMPLSTSGLEIENQRSKREVMKSDMGKIFRNVLRSLNVQH